MIYASETGLDYSLLLGRIGTSYGVPLLTGEVERGAIAEGIVYFYSISDGAIGRLALP